MRKKEKWLLFVMPSLVKMRLSRLVSRDNRIIYNILPLLMPGAARRAFQIVLRQKKLPHKLCSSLSDAGLIPRCGWRLPGSSATARTPSMRNTAGHSPAHWVQPMHSSGSTNAFMQTPPCGKHCPFCRKLCLCKRFTVWYNKTAGNRQEEIR